MPILHEPLLIARYSKALDLRLADSHAAGSSGQGDQKASLPVQYEHSRVARVPLYEEVAEQSEQLGLHAKVNVS